MMENNEKKYWKGLEELHETPEFTSLKQREFAEELPIDELLSDSKINTATPRRDFLKALGFGMSAVALAACNEAPVRKAIPYLIKPEEITPGVANYYTSNYNGLGVLVKTREGRPIKIEGNPKDPIGMGGTNASAQASVLDLYDVGRLKNPVLKKAESTWDALDKFVKSNLTDIAANNGTIYILSGTVMSPSTKSVINGFITKYPSAKHISYDAVSSSAIINANKNSFDKAVLPSYQFDKADVIVSFGADFLGTWISPVEYTKQYVKNRNNKSLEAKKMSRHIQFESGLSLTGTNADTRVAIKPSQEGIAILALYNALAKLSGAATYNVPAVPFADKIDATAKELWKAKGKSLVVSGSNDVSVQVAINAINSLLENFGTTIDLDNVSYQKQGSDAEMIELVAEMNAGKVDALFVYGCNPAYSYAHADEFNEGLKKVKLKVSFSDREDETAVLCDAIAPDNHYLESWNDTEVKPGIYSIVQPVIAQVYNSRQAQQSLMLWADNTDDYYQFIQNNWEKSIYPKQSQYAGFKKLWEGTLQTGVLMLAPVTPKAYTFSKDLNSVAMTIVNANKAASGKIELSVYENVGVGDGTGSNNPFLQELPDPVTKVTWDNYAAINPNFAKELGIKENTLVEVKSGSKSIKLPVLMQPGQAMGAISVAVGYGRTNAGKAGNNVGANIYPFVSQVNGGFQYYNASIELNATGDSYELAQTQTHHTIEGRNIIQEKTFSEYTNHDEHASHAAHGAGHKVYDLWPAYESNGHHWAMSIDLNACTGCSACVIACNTENNIPVVGRDEVRRRREMHWLRIDRYYTLEGADGSEITKEKQYKNVENYENVKVVHQPMLCQHCDHAPCETVCPVLATMHSSEGLNQMAYNRCVGTRYCANNCPYKVRRFNWFNYWNDSRFENYLHNESAYLALNPDVTTRSRGVMEKCSFCAQRIQESKLAAKMEKRVLKDGDVKVACQQGCPANAIVFGDVNDPESEVSKLLKSERTYYVLEELNVQPGIGYMKKIRNTVEA